VGAILKEKLNTVSKHLLSSNQNRLLIACWILILIHKNIQNSHGKINLPWKCHEFSFVTHTVGTLTISSDVQYMAACFSASSQSTLM